LEIVRAFAGDSTITKLLPVLFAMQTKQSGVGILL
jgi:hypothetical protein